MAGDFFCFQEIECIIKLKGGIILNPDNFDELIKKYSEALVEMGQVYGGEEDLPKGNIAVKSPEIAHKEVSDEEESESEESENVENEAEMLTEQTKNRSSEAESEKVDTSPAVKEPSAVFPQGEVTSAATFFSRVFTAENAYPIEGAKVVVYREDNIYAFLETDAEGRTKTVSLPAFEKSNSLDENSEYQSIDYLADVFAAGFIPQKGLLVSSVGGSDIVLNVLLIPEEEGLR